jgi:hypothetical protein
LNFYWAGLSLDFSKNVQKSKFSPKKLELAPRKNDLSKPIFGAKRGRLAIDPGLSRIIPKFLRKIRVFKPGYKQNWRRQNRYLENNFNVTSVDI